MKNENDTLSTIVSNKLILSRANFTVPQRRILSVIVESLSPNLRQDMNIKSGKEIGYQLGAMGTTKLTYRAADICRPDDYGELRKGIEDLMNRKTNYIETEERIRISRFILVCNWAKRSETLELLIDEELFRMLLDLSEGYTTYQTKVVLSFSSIYAMRLYEIICKWKNKPMFYLSLLELRRMTDTQDKYPVLKDFKKKVLDIAKQQLDNSDITDLTFDYKVKKQGREVVGFDIYINKTKNVPKDILVSIHFDFEKDVVEKLKSYGFLGLKGKNHKLVLELKRLLGVQVLGQKVKDICEYIDNHKVNNPAGYIVKSLQKYLLDNKTEPADMNPEQRKKHAEDERKKEPVQFGDLFNQFKK